MGSRPGEKGNVLVVSEEGGVDRWRGKEGEEEEERLQERGREDIYENKYL